MGTGYTRQSSASIQTGEDITAAPLNAEFNAVQSAFDGSTGHSHDGTSGEGQLIDLTTSITGVLPVASGGIAAINKIDATAAPTTGDDSGDGYGPGSLWVDVTNDTAYVCLDATSTAAVWRQVSFEATIAALEDLLPTDSNFIVGNGSTWVAESGATARTSLGVGTGDSPQFTAVNLGHASDTTITRVSSGVIAVEGDTVLMSSANIGSTIQAYDAALDDISGLAVTDGNIIVGDGANWVAESGATARASLGLTIGTDVQAYDAELAAIAGLTSASNKIVRFTGSGTADLLDFVDEDNMASDSATSIPSQQSVKAYVDSQVGGVGFDLGDLGDVTITSIATGEIIKYNGSAYINNTLAEAGIVGAADFSADSQVLVGTGSGTYQAESGSTLRTSLGLAIGTDVQAYSANLDDNLGDHVIWIPAGAMLSATTNGAEAGTVEETTNAHNYNYLAFDASTDEYACFEIAMPESWNEGTLTYKAVWSSTATDTDGVSWALQAVAVADGDDADVAYGTAIVVDDANQSNAGDVLITAESSAMTVAGSPAAGELTQFRVFRDVSDANDTATEDALLRGLYIYYTVNDGTDA